MKKFTLIVAAVSFVALATLAYGEMGGKGMASGMMCCCGMDGKMMDAEHHMAKLIKDLNLDDQQKVFMGEIKSRMMKETIRRKADMHIAQIELKELLMQDTVDMTAVEAKVKQLEAMKTEMQLSHIKAMEECKAKLTPEQRKKLKEMLEAEPMHEMKHDQKSGMKEKKAAAKRHHTKEKVQ